MPPFQPKSSPSNPRASRDRAKPEARNIFALIALLALAACATPNTNISSVREQIAVSERFLTAGNYREGYKILDTIAAQNAGSKETALGLADAYFRHGALLKAVGFYGEAVRLGAARRGMVGLGRVALARNDGTAAAANFERVLARKPDDIDALNGLGVAFDLQQRHDQAQAYYYQVLSLAPSDAHAHNNLALSLLLSGDGAGAYARLTQASQSNIDNKTIRQNLALAQYMAGDANGALETAMLDLSAEEARSNFALVERILRR